MWQKIMESVANFWTSTNNVLQLTIYIRTLIAMAKTSDQFHNDHSHSSDAFIYPSLLRANESLTGVGQLLPIDKVLVKNISFAHNYEIPNVCTRPTKASFSSVSSKILQNFWHILNRFYQRRKKIFTLRGKYSKNPKKISFSSVFSQFPQSQVKSGTENSKVSVK